jgi:hypothetical protein
VTTEADLKLNSQSHYDSRVSRTGGSAGANPWIEPPKHPQNTVTCTNSVQEYAGDVYLTVLATTSAQRLPTMMKFRILANSANSCADSVHTVEFLYTPKITLVDLKWQIELFFSY